MNSETYRLKIESGKAFAMPAHLVKPHQDAIRAALGRNIQMRHIQVGELNIPAFLFPGRINARRTVERLFGNGRPLSDVTSYRLLQGQTGNRSVYVLATDKTDVEVIEPNIEPAKMSDDIAEQNRVKDVHGIYRELLEDFSRLTGWRVVYHTERLCPIAPEPLKERVLHIRLNSVPHGDFEERYRVRAFGLNIKEASHTVLGVTPSRGRGIILGDETNEPLVQLLENTAYLLIPIVDPYHGAESKQIFQKLMGLIWDGLTKRANKKLRPAVEETGKRSFVEQLTKTVTCTPEHWKASVEKTELEIAAKQHELQDLYRRLREFNAVADAHLRDGAFKASVDRLPGDYNAIRRHPLVERVSVCEHGVHVDTKLISIVHEGDTYPIGTFTIRVNGLGHVAIWAKETKHLTGVPHPHMRRHGVPCFGSASQAIAQAAGEMRFADCIALTLRWLKDGYEPDTASHRIGEWLSTRMENITIKDLNPLMPEMGELIPHTAVMLKPVTIHLRKEPERSPDESSNAQLVASR